MTRWLKTAALLYPRSWRARYGAQLDALIDDSGGGWSEFTDICKGAIVMQILRLSVWRFAGGCALAGMMIAGVMAWRAPSHYQSVAVLRMPGEMNDDSLDKLNKAEVEILSRRSLAALIQRENLYPKERTREPLEDIVARMRNQDVQIRILSVPGSKAPAGAFTLAFDGDDPARAQAVTRDLTTRFVTAMQPAAPLEVLDPASLPERAFAPNRAAWAAAGLFLGLAAGFAILGIRRWPLVALTGLVTAALVWPATYIVPDRFRSVAVLRNGSSNAAQAVTGVIGDRAYLQSLIAQLGLYPSEANAVEKMRQSLLTMTPTAKACVLSFEYSDRYKAQQVLREIVARAGGVDVLDPPSLAERPFTPNRLALVLCGLFAGLLLGVLILAYRSRRTPALVA